MRYFVFRFLASEDYNSVINETLIFFNSSNRDTEMCYNISINNDMAVESNETFRVTVSSTDESVNLLNNVSVVTIIDDDSKLIRKVCTMYTVYLLQVKVVNSTLNVNLNMNCYLFLCSTNDIFNVDGIFGC